MQNSFEKSISPFLQFSAFVTKTTGSAVSQHLQSIEAFTKLNLDNFYAGMKARTMTEAISFAKKQPEFLKQSSELFIKESKVYANLCNNTYDTSQELYTKNFKNMYLEAPKIKTELFDLGTSIIIKESEPEMSAPKPVLKTTSKSSSRKKRSVNASVNQARNAPQVTVSSKKTTEKLTKNSPSQAQSSKPTTKTSVKENVITSTPVKPKNIKKPVLVKTKSKKSSVKPLAVKPTKTSKVTTIKNVITATEEASVKQEPKVLNTLQKTNNTNAPVWEKPKSSPQLILPSDEKIPTKLSPVTKLETTKETKLRTKAKSEVLSKKLPPKK